MPETVLWNCSEAVFFTDESRFNLFERDGCQRVYQDGMSVTELTVSLKAIVKGGGGLSNDMGRCIL